MNQTINKFPSDISGFQEAALNYMLHHWASTSLDRNYQMKTPVFSKTERHQMHLWCASLGLKAETYCERLWSHESYNNQPMVIYKTSRTYRKLLDERKRLKVIPFSRNIYKLIERILNIGLEHGESFTTRKLKSQDIKNLLEWIQDTGFDATVVDNRIVIGLQSVDMQVPTPAVQAELPILGEPNLITPNNLAQNVQVLKATGLDRLTTPPLSRADRHSVHVWCAENDLGHQTIASEGQDKQMLVTWTVDKEDTPSNQTKTTASNDLTILKLVVAELEKAQDTTATELTTQELTKAQRNLVRSYCGKNKLLHVTVNNGDESSPITISWERPDEIPEYTTAEAVVNHINQALGEHPSGSLTTGPISSSERHKLHSWCGSRGYTHETMQYQDLAPRIQITWSIMPWSADLEIYRADVESNKRIFTAELSNRHLQELLQACRSRGKPVEKLKITYSPQKVWSADCSGYYLVIN